MRENISILSTKVIQIGLVLVAFLIPIFFLPTTSEFYNFNKTTLLTLAAFFLFVVWSLKMVAEQRVRMTRTPLDVPLLVFLGFYILSSLFSLDPVMSFLGWHPTFFGSLPSISALVLMYFIATSHLDATYRRVVYIALAVSASLLGLLFLANFFGQPLLGASWAKIRSWTPAGDVNKLVAFLAVSIPLTIAAALFTKDQIVKYFLYGLVVVQILAFALINSLFAYASLGVGLLITLLFLPKIKLSQEEKIGFGILAGLLAVILLLVNVKPLGDPILKPLIAGNETNTSVNKPVRMPLSESWQTSAQALAQRPILGTGPSTFGLIFPSLKPISLNRINENNLWNVRFDETGSSILTILSTSGVLGILAFLAVIVFLARGILSANLSNNHQNRLAFLFLQSAIVASAVNFLLFDLSVINATVFIVLSAAFYATLRDWGSSMASEVDLRLVAFRSGVIQGVEAGGAPRRATGMESIAWVFFVPALLLFAAILVYSWGTYRAEFYYQKAITASQENKGKDTRDNIVAAIRANPYRDTYRRALLVTDLALARVLNQKGNLTKEEQTTLASLINEAIEQGRIVTGYEGRGLGSFNIKRQIGTTSANVANWESLATVYSNIGGELRNDSTVHAINTFSRAIQLDPTNPRLYEALGDVYFNVGDLDNAKKNYELSITAKRDYASSHYKLAQVYKRKGDNPGGVVTELSFALQLLEDTEQNKAARAQIQKELDEAQKKVDEAKKQQSPAPQLPTATPSSNR